MRSRGSEAHKGKSWERAALRLKELPYDSTGALADGSMHIARDVGAEGGELEEVVLEVSQRA